MSEVVRQFHEIDGKIVETSTQDSTDTLEHNKQAKAAQPEHYKYLNGKQLFHAAKIDIGFIDQMANGQCCSNGTSYKFLTADKEERKRALLHVQSAHKEWMMVDGKPFAKNKSLWI
jgi:hypothetical protein